MRSVTWLAMAALAAGVVFTHGAAQAASAENGKMLFQKNGCWQCHGTQGQGGVAGKTLAPDPLPLETLSAFIRSSNGPMPPYMEAILSNDDVADIHAYLSSIPKTTDFKSIPLLNDLGK